MPQWDTLGIIWGFDNAIIHNCQNREKLILTEVDWTHTGLQLHHNTFFLLDRVSFYYLSHNRDIWTINTSYFRGSEQYVFSHVRKSIVATKCFWQQDRNDIVYKCSIFCQLVRDCTSKSNITSDQKCSYLEVEAMGKFHSLSIMCHVLSTCVQASIFQGEGVTT